MVYQHSYVYSISDIGRQSKISCDYFLAFNEGQKKLFASTINDDICISGSVKSNCNVLKRTTNLYDILLISQYREHVSEVRKDLYTQLSVLINEYIVNKKMKLGIAYYCKRTDKDRKTKYE